ENTFSKDIAGSIMNKTRVCHKSRSCAPVPTRAGQWEGVSELMLTLPAIESSATSAENTSIDVTSKLKTLCARTNTKTLFVPADQNIAELFGIAKYDEGRKNEIQTVELRWKNASSTRQFCATLPLRLDIDIVIGCNRTVPFVRELGVVET